MKSIEAYNMIPTTPQSNNKTTYNEVGNSQCNNAKKLSVEKMRNMISINMKKSPSTAIFSPFPLTASTPKLMFTQKTTLTKINTSKSKPNSKSPGKAQYRTISHLPVQSASETNQEKRKKIYALPYLINNQEEINFTVPYMMHPEHRFSETISTECSQKDHNRLKVTDFEIGRELGAGKFGHVHLAKHRKTGFICALKKIKKQGLDQVLQTQLIREIKIQTFLNHPNIIKLYSFFCDDDDIYLVLQTCCSGQLYSFLKKHHPVKQQLAKVIIRQVCQALDYIHENQIIHRDLKPQNILYHNSMMKICDFGWSIATPLMRDTFCGTPLYVSPELLKRNNYNNKVDIWSLGILAFEILVGHVPFEIFSESDYIKIIKNEVRFPRFVNLSEQARDFIKCCLEKEPEMRATSRYLLQHPFIKKVQLDNFSQID